MAISLITPVGANFLKDFPSQNAVNCDRIDAYAGPSLITHEMLEWTPVFTAVTTNPILGSGGFIRGFYYQIWDQIFAWAEFRFGSSGGNVGSGTWMMTLPFPAKANIGFSTTLGGAPIVGNGACWDDSTSANRQPCTVHLRNSTQVMFGIRMNSGLGVREVGGTSSPFAWTASDGMNWFARYQREP